MSDMTFGRAVRGAGTSTPCKVADTIRCQLFLYLVALGESGHRTVDPKIKEKRKKGAAERMELPLPIRTYRHIRHEMGWESRHGMTYIVDSKARLTSHSFFHIFNRHERMNSRPDRCPSPPDSRHSRQTRVL